MDAPAAAADEEYEDIGYIAPPTQPAAIDRRFDPSADLPSLPLDLDDLIDSTQASSTSSAANSASAGLTNSLLIAWQNELHAPSLLPYQFALVRDIQSLLAARQFAIDSASETDSSSNTLASAPTWQLNLYQLELDRVQYVLLDYHRLRLTKVQSAPIALTLHVTQQAGARRPETLTAEEVEARLDVSRAELVFLLGYVDIWERVMRGEYLDNMPPASLAEQAKQLLGSGQGMEMVKRYDEDWHVLVRVVEGEGRERVVMDDIEVELREGEIWLVRFEPFKQHLKDGKVQLI